MKKVLFLLVVVTVLVGCSKTPVLEVSEDLVGEWRHYTGVGNSHLIIINDNGEGHMEWEVDGKISKTTKTRKWYLDDNILSFGKAAFKRRVIRNHKISQNSLGGNHSLSRYCSGIDKVHNIR